MRSILLTEDLKRRLLEQDAGAWKEISALITRCANYSAWKVGAAHLAEDVAAEVLLLMHSQFLRHLGVGAPLNAFLLEACRRVALSMRRKRFEDRLVSSDDEEGQALHEPAQDDMTPLIHAKLAAERARQRIKTSVTADFWRPDKQQQPRAPRNQYGCGDHRLAAALKAERMARGWTQRQMASYMGLGLPTYISYEHACVITPNPDVVDMLRKMQRERTRALQGG